MLIDGFTNDDNYLYRIMNFANKDTRLLKKDANLSVNKNIKEFKLSTI